MHPLKSFKQTINLVVEYTAKGIRVQKSFTSVAEAKRFYTAKDRAGANPILKAANKEQTMKPVNQSYSYFKAIKQGRISQATSHSNPAADTATTETPKPIKAVKTSKQPKTDTTAATNGHAKELTGLAAEHPEWQGKTCNFRKDGSLTAMQIKVLGILAKCQEPTTISAMAKKSGQEKWPKLIRWAIGNIKDEGRDPFSLLERKLVRQSTSPDENWVYAITAAGRKALAQIEKSSK